MKPFNVYDEGGELYGELIEFEDGHAFLHFLNRKYPPFNHFTTVESINEDLEIQGFTKKTWGNSR